MCGSGAAFMDASEFEDNLFEGRVADKQAIPVPVKLFDKEAL
jgi:hypothetical protein